MEKLNDFIKDCARTLGFAEVGIVQAGPSNHFDAFRDWLAAGYSAGMGYLGTPRALECRRDPRALFPETKAIIVVMARYPARKGDQRMASGMLSRVASYAWGRDYHLVMKEQLERLAAMIQEFLHRPYSYHISIDSDPLQERAIAASAGLGWIGRNSCLISPIQGSYTFLAELLVDLEISTNERFLPDRCGRCKRCIEACPTGCILPDRRIDARRCIAYLTIEHRGEIPAQLCNSLEGWVFGCDVCQVVCPWNQKVGDGNVDPSYLPDKAWSGKDLNGELLISPAEFKSRFNQSPVSRAKWRGYIRNIALAIGRQRDSSGLEVLSQLGVSEDDPEILSAVQWATRQINHV